MHRQCGWCVSYAPRRAVGLRLTVRQVVDTVLAKLHVATGKLPDLSALIDQLNAVVVPKIEPELVKTRNIGVLCRLYQQHGDNDKLFNAWSKLVDGEWTDSQVQDPLTRIFELLSGKRDRSPIQRWVPWLVRKDSDRALKVCEQHARSSLLGSLPFTSYYPPCPQSGKPKTTASSQRMREASPAAGVQLLEHLVVQSNVR